MSSTESSVEDISLLCANLLFFERKNVNFVWNWVDISRDFQYNTKRNKYKPTQNYINKPEVTLLRENKKG